MLYFSRSSEAHITAVYVDGQIRSQVESVFTWVKLILILPTILDKTVGKVSTFEVFIASLPSPLLQCCAKRNGFSGKLLSYLPTLNRGEGGYVRESETISFEL